jgi:rod shape-determining protein MreC
VAGRTSRSARGDSRTDGALLALALIVAALALALPEPRTDRIAGALRNTVLAPLTSIQRRAERARSSLLVRDSVTYARDVAAVRNFDAERIAAENDRLRSLLGLGARLKTGFVAVEAMHGPSLGEEHTLVLNAGAQAGIVKFSPLVAPEGIVGYVRSVGPTSSVAIVWPHPDFRVSAMAANKAASGIVTAHLADGAARFLLELRGVPFRAPLDSGVLIVSSGIGGTFPRGVPIGTVIRQLPTTEGWERNYLIMPAVHPADVNTALVLLPVRTSTDVSSVWSAADSAATALKRAVAAGDSLARAAAGRDTTSRPASRDTVRRRP